VLARIPDGGPYLITIDGDGMDPSVMPAVNAPVPGGLSFLQAADLLHGLARKGPIAGFDIVELAPRHDVNGLSSLAAARLILNLIGAMVRSGQLG
ncbi:MAG: arginase family protein, partial [Dongiaceae bacterium]